MEKPFLVFSGTSNQPLASEIATELGNSLGKIQIERFPDGEIGVQILENVRGRDVFVIQSIAHDPSLYLMELLIIVDALKRASAKAVYAVLPYYGYARQDRRDGGRVPITAKLVANLLQTAGVNHVITLDVHAEQIQGFFDVPVENLYARPLFVAGLEERALSDIVAVTPDVGSIRLARLLAEDLKTEFAIIDKKRVSAAEVHPQALIGAVNGKTAVIVDDICSSGSTLKAAAKVCREHGAKKVIACVTHSLNDEQVFERDEIDEFWITNSIHVPKTSSKQKTRTFSVGPLFAKAMQLVVEGGSVSSLFSGKASQ